MGKNSFGGFTNGFAAGCTPVVVVNAEIESEVARLLPEAHLVVNPDPDAGRTGSLQLGIEALEVVMGAKVERLVMAPVDRPAWNDEVLMALLEGPGDFAPSFDGRKASGRFAPAAIEAVKNAEPHHSLREMVVFKPVAVVAPWLHYNIDTDDDGAFGTKQCSTFGLLFSRRRDMRAFC